MICECCKKEECAVKDYRTDPETGVSGSYRVCRECFNRNDYSFFKLIYGEKNERK